MRTNNTRWWYSKHVRKFSRFKWKRNLVQKSWSCPRFAQQAYVSLFMGKNVHKNYPRLWNGRKCALLAKSWPEISKWQRSQKSSSDEIFYFRRFSPRESITQSKHKRTQHGRRRLQYGDSRSCCRCDSCTEPESGGGFRDEVLGLYRFDLSSAETDPWWLDEE